jgi:hypothetical protein
MKSIKLTALAAGMLLALGAAAQDANPIVNPTQAMPSASNPMSSNPSEQRSTMGRTPFNPSIPPDEVGPNELNRPSRAPMTALNLSSTASKFDALDRNHDGQISRSEADAELALGFASFDADGDGLLSRAEFARLRTEKVARARSSDPREPDRFR